MNWAGGGERRQAAEWAQAQKATGKAGRGQAVWWGGDWHVGPELIQAAVGVAEGRTGAEG